MDPKSYTAWDADRTPSSAPTNAPTEKRLPSLVQLRAMLEAQLQSNGTEEEDPAPAPTPAKTAPRPAQSNAPDLPTLEQLLRLQREDDEEPAPAPRAATVSPVAPAPRPAQPTRTVAARPAARTQTAGREIVKKTPKKKPAKEWRVSLKEQEAPAVRQRAPQEQYEAPAPQRPPQYQAQAPAAQRWTQDQAEAPAKAKWQSGADRIPSLSQLEALLRSEDPVDPRNEAPEDVAYRPAQPARTPVYRTEEEPDHNAYRPAQPARTPAYRTEEEPDHNAYRPAQPARTPAYRTEKEPDYNAYRPAQPARTPAYRTEEEPDYNAYRQTEATRPAPYDGLRPQETVSAIPAEDDDSRDSAGLPTLAQLKNMLDMLSRTHEDDADEWETISADAKAYLRDRQPVYDPAPQREQQPTCVNAPAPAPEEAEPERNAEDGRLPSASQLEALLKEERTFGNTAFQESVRQARQTSQPPQTAQPQKPAEQANPNKVCYIPYETFAAAYQPAQEQTEKPPRQTGQNVFDEIPEPELLSPEELGFTDEEPDGKSKRGGKKRSAGANGSDAARRKKDQTATRQAARLSWISSLLKSS